MNESRCSLGRVLALVLVAAVSGSCGSDTEHDADRFVQRAEAAAAAGRLEDAIIEYRNALQRRPRRADVQYRLAVAYEAAGEIAHAAESFIAAAELEPGNLQASLKACDALLAARRPGDAERLAAAALARHPLDVAALVMHARTLLGMDRTGIAERDLRQALAIDPRSSPAMLILGVLHLRRGQRAEAEDAMRAAVRYDSRSPDAHLALAELLREAGSPDAAEQEYVEALAAAGGRSTVRRRVVAFYVATGQLAKAEAHLRVLADESPEDRLRLADFYIAQDRPSDAESALSSLGPAWTAAVRLRTALVRARAGRHPEALSLLESAIADPHVESDARLLRSQVRLTLGDTAGAIEDAQRAARMQPSAPGPVYQLGLIHLAEGRLPEAERRFKEARDLGGDARATDDQLVRVAARQGKYAAAVGAARRLAQQAPSPASSVLLAQALRLDGDVRAARSEIASARARWPDAAPLDVEFGMLEQSAGRVAGARQAYRRALARDPKAALAANNLAWLLARDGRYPEALQLARQAAAASSSPQVLDTLGWMYHLAGQSDAAVRALTAARDAMPSNPLYHHHLGLVYLRMARLADAHESLARALALSQTYEGADEARRLVRTGR